MIGGIILAAGRSDRMGSPKPLLELRGRPFIQWVWEGMSKSGASPIVAVSSPAVSREIESLDLGELKVLQNDRPELEMAESIKIGLREIGSDSAAAMIALADHPFVERATYKILIETAKTEPGKIVMPVCDDRQGHPVIVPRKIFAEIESLPADRGMNSVIEAHENDVVEVAVSDGGIFLDIDTPEELQAALKLHKN